MLQVSTIAFVLFAIVSANAFTADQIRFQQETLVHHNTLRARHCAANLALDDNLNKIAQSYAEKLVNTNSFAHSNNGYGENLYMMSSSASLASLHGKTATQSWYDEVKDYNYSQPGFSAKVGHFTQVIWKNSKQLGVGVAFSKDGRKAVVVTNYSPPGNYMNQFDQNVLRAQC
ncbi:unnamed protein product [Adineta steineri]|uniref:SCP domain-containing protein n=1 Tax=Adineta steineri TaxID=433720 RepID=A0A819CD54_9BILA|nr:unnamed protein product [Adineta steineri]CAF1190180.1 unnamed protein product [Adineta steineri]CAF3713414.1 unnamed protein product [Adineta steineri]CAF3809995.1 unnamed protein product [Adineta steineri]